jgi:hypothetical protein
VVTVVTYAIVIERAVVVCKLFTASETALGRHTVKQALPREDLVGHALVELGRELNRVFHTEPPVREADIERVWVDVFTRW